MLKHQNESKTPVSRPKRGERGVPLTTFDAQHHASMERGSELLLTTLKHSHPRIINQLIRKNGTGNGQFSVPR
jgi:hypothetical protein